MTRRRWLVDGRTHVCCPSPHESRAKAEHGEVEGRGVLSARAERRLGRRNLWMGRSSLMTAAADAMLQAGRHCGLKLKSQLVRYHFTVHFI